jgi:hypothetical protein
MPVSYSCTTQNFAPILQWQRNLHLHIVIRHAPNIQHTILCSVLVHILECSYKWKKVCFCQHAKSLTVAPVFDLLLWGMELEIKWIYKHCYFSGLNEYFCFYLSSATHHSSTLAFPLWTSYSIFPCFPATSLSSSPHSLNVIKYVSKRSDCVDSNNGTMGE